MRSLDELADVIGAMRGLAAARGKEAQEARRGVERHAEIVRAALVACMHLAFPEVMPSVEAKKGPRLFVVLASEHGFAGAFNDHVLDRAASELASPEDRILVLGARGASLAEERKLPLAGSLHMATHAGGVLEVARRAADEVYACVARREFVEVHVVHGASTVAASFEVEVRRLLPIHFPDKPIERTKGPPPLANLEPSRLLDKLADELVFAELMRAAMASFAAENAARLSAMAAAHENVEEKLATLGIEARERRQDEITSEMLDVVTGAVAMEERG